MGLETLRTDVIRKELFKTDAGPEKDYGQGVYSRHGRSLTYGKMLERALDALKAGRSLILDASFGDRGKRREAIRLADMTGAQMVFVECIAPMSLLEDRLRRRESTDSVSDARRRHLNRIQKAFDPLTELPPRIHIQADTGGSADDAYRRVLSESHRLLSCP
jgi:predicted kinase